MVLNIFSKQVNPEQVVAMFNLEMIGTESKWERTQLILPDMKIEYGRNSSTKPRDQYLNSIQIRIQSNNCSIVLIMLLWQDLGFLPIRYRHPKWIMSPISKASDEIGTLDMKNGIIKAIASSSTIVSGKIRLRGRYH
jgi:hypothetical protein